MLSDHVLLGFGWAIYCVLHSVLASLGAKSFFQKQLGIGYRYYRLAYTLFAFAGLAGLVWVQLSIQSLSIYIPNVFTAIVGAIVCGCGVVIMGICIRKYFLNLSGLRSLAQEEVRPVLEIKGIHRYVRHPLYFGTFLFIWGLLLLFPLVSLALTNLIITIYTLLALKFEEKKLVGLFGDAYKVYQQDVPQIVPNLR